MGSMVVLPIGSNMNTVHTSDEVMLAETQKADEQIVFSGQPIPPDVAERVRERARRIRERVFKEQGLVDISVPGVRDFRDR